jgi:hypothetical protein
VLTLPPPSISKSHLVVSLHLFLVPSKYYEQVEKEGVSGLFAGVGAKGAHSWISSFIYFLAFSSLKRHWEARTVGGCIS